jgi:hypothetical protein
LHLYETKLDHIHVEPKKKINQNPNRSRRDTKENNISTGNNTMNMKLKELRSNVVSFVVHGDNFENPQLLKVNSSLESNEQ